VIKSNKAWAESLTKSDPEFLENLSKGQAPKILWIGCSDSRLPETTLLGLKPGEVFVHRNIANILTPTDLSSLSCIEYAVVYLKVKHIILCGHTSCGGVAAALDNKRLGTIDTWLMPLRQVRMENSAELEGLGPADRARKLVELNVHQGVAVLKSNPNVIDAMKERGLDVHGMVYDLAKGELIPVDVPEKHEGSRASAFGIA
jgi:carbonic anhydrase